MSEGTQLLGGGQSRALPPELRCLVWSPTGPGCPHPVQGARPPTSLVSRGSLHLGLMSAGLRGWWGSAPGCDACLGPPGVFLSTPRALSHCWPTRAGLSQWRSATPGTLRRSQIFHEPSSSRVTALSLLLGRGKAPGSPAEVGWWVCR